MVRVREQILRRERDLSFQPFRSALLRGGDPPERVEVSVEGLDHVWLIADVGDDQYDYDQAVWAELELVDKAGEIHRVSSLKPESVKVGWGELLRDKSHIGKPLEIGGREFSHGLWAHAPSELCFSLDGKYVSLRGYVGISSVAGQNGSSRFHVLNRKDTVSSSWEILAKRYPLPCRMMMRDLPGKHLDWFQGERDSSLDQELLRRSVAELGRAGKDVKRDLERLVREHAEAGDPGFLVAYLEAMALRERFRQAREEHARIDWMALRRTVEDLAFSFQEGYPHGRVRLDRIGEWESRWEDLEEALGEGDWKAVNLIEKASEFQRQALLDNPLLDFDYLLVVKRSEGSPRLGLPQNWQGNSALPARGYNNEIAKLSVKRTRQEMSTVYRPEQGRFVGDVDLHFDAQRILFSMPDERDRWQIWEINVDGSALRQVTLGSEDDVDNYDPCYLPDERILYVSTATMWAVPCVYGGTHVGNLFRMDRDGSNARQLCFDQDENWCPTLLHHGKVLYTRWEYTDTPHSNTRILFHMNPDGTQQMEYYGSNSYWPNGIFYARPVPGHPTMVAGIVSGHHGVPRMGELVLFDPALGRREADGVIQRVPGYGQSVEPVVKDALVDASWPKFLHPFPLSDKYLITACKPSMDHAWGIYLVDVFDNLLMLREEPGHALLEPVPLRDTTRPPVLPDRVNLDEKDATVYLVDIYQGQGLRGLPKGTVQGLRLFTYVYSYRGMGGLLGSIGMDGPWDIKRVLGTVPVREDGSAIFQVPANTPISVQPLDQEGKALQLMRSWFTAMPGEILSCVGCHESQNQAPPIQSALASLEPPSSISPWRGPVRGFSFSREVQPVLDRSCLACHDGREGLPNLKGTERITDWSSKIPGHVSPAIGGNFSVAYVELHRYVRRPGIESDYHLLSPMEFHADTTELVGMLRKGHQGVELDEEGWDRLITWIDLNAPYHGTWTEIVGEDAVRGVAARQQELLRKYAGLEVDYESIWEAHGMDRSPVAPSPLRIPEEEVPDCLEGFLWTADDQRRIVDLGEGVELELVWVPRGSFLMGNTEGHADERPVQCVSMEAFLIGVSEITNEQYARFDPRHDSGVQSKHGYQFGVHGFPLNLPKQPVVRVSWNDAMAFCQWLSERAGKRFKLPTEAQWEYACRAGSQGSFHFGDLRSDFSPYANMADLTLRQFATNPYTLWEPIQDPNPYDDWIPRDDRFNDGQLVSSEVGVLSPNAWGIHDMHGNVWEWTRSLYLPYPYMEGDGRNDTRSAGRRVVRGGSWYDRPKLCTASTRLDYWPYQPVFNVGFRVVCIP